MSRLELERNQEGYTGKRRAKCGCGKAACFNVEGEKGWYCGSCKKEGMVNVVCRRCVATGCTRQPLFNVPGETTPLYCGPCKQPEMENVVFKRCAMILCTSYPAFNAPDKKSGMFCGVHKQPGMINLLSRKCQGKPAGEGSSCLRTAVYDVYGSNKPRFCSDCKLDGMVDVFNPRCLTPLCDTFATVKRYRGYCVRCFVHQFPDEPVARNYKTKEAAVHDFLVTRFPDLPWTWDKRVDGGCSGKRPDFVLHLGSHVLIVEVDEGQHAGYGSICENKRTMMLSQDLGHVPLVLIRFNPDQYVRGSGARVQSCWMANKRGLLVVPPGKRAEWEARLDRLAAEVDTWLRVGEVEKTVQEVRLFYDGC